MHALEDSLTDQVRNWLDVQLDVSWYKASDRYHKGVSDCIICCCGFFIAAELKAEDKISTPHQNLFIASTKRAKGIGGVCYTLHDVKCLIQVARDRYKNYEY